MSRLISLKGQFFIASVLILTTRLDAAPRSAIGSSEAIAIRQSYGKLPLSFEANRGQTDQSVKYLSRGSGYTLYLTSTEAVLQLPDNSHSALRIKFLGGNPAAKAEALDLLPGITNYYLGSDPAKWHTNIPNYQRVALRGVYPGIDLVFYGNQRQLEYDVVVKPGADPSQVRLKFEGAEKVLHDSNGDLTVKAGGIEIRQRKPMVYQVVDGQRHEIKGGYRLRGTNELAFNLAHYDRTKELVIDPVLIYSTYLGGSGSDYSGGIAVDSSSNAYVTGITNSTPFLAPGSNVFSGTTTAAFIVKINPQGSALVYTTYLGGLTMNSTTGGNAIATDSTGDAYVTGFTNGGFGVSANALQPTFGGGTSNAFVAEIAPQGGVIYATYLGGNNNDMGNGIAVDASGNAYVTGTTAGGFPVVNALQASYGGAASDAFVAKVNAAGTALVYATYLGGSTADAGEAITVDSSGNAYVAGNTAGGFPVASALQTIYAGGLDDAFVTKINAQGTALVYSTYLGGSGIDSANAIALDPSNNVYVAGFTSSSNFPVTAGVLQSTFGGNASQSGGDAFVAKINTQGSALVYATYLGGSGDDQGAGIGVDAAGYAYVTGYTTGGFPVVNAGQATYGGGAYDAFVSKINPQGTAAVYSTYLGGTLQDNGKGIAVTSTGDAYVTGWTYSSNFPVDRPLQQNNAGPVDSFVTRFVAPTKAGVFRSGFFWLEDVDGNQMFNNPPDRAFAFGGNAGDVPITGDWNGDGHTKVGVYRPRSGLFVLDSNGNGMFDSGDAVYNLGVGVDPTDIPVVGDWNGDGRSKIGIFRQGFEWLLDYNGNGVYDGPPVDRAYFFGGVTGDVPVTGDWTGSGTSKIGLVRQGFYWLLDANGNGTYDGTGAGNDYAFPFGGISGDVPVVGDWNGSGTTKVGVFRMGFFWVLDANGNQQFDGGGAGGDFAFAFGGIQGDKPVTGKW